jgi:hypothetical protein
MKKWILVPVIGMVMGCSSLNNNMGYEKYERLIIRNYGKVLITGYDSDKDGMEDLRYYYENVAIRADKRCFELMKVMEDKNKDGAFEDDEVIWQRKINKKDLGTPLINVPFTSS